MLKEKDFHFCDPTWCSGCGIYSIFSALKKTAVTLEMKPEETVVVTGIGCHGRLNNYFKAYGFHTLHGRSLPVAQGIKLANRQLSVIAVSGDGDTYSIGLGHFIHALRRNVNLTYVVVNNMIYGLTQGQTSPTSRKGFVSKSTPLGSKESPLCGPHLALVSGGTFIARGFSGAPKQLSSLLEKGIQHTGFSLIEVFSPCVTHNLANTYDWFRRNTFDVDQAKGYDPRNREKAWEFLNNRQRLAMGLLYQEKSPSFDDLVLPVKTPLVQSQMFFDQKKWDKIFKEFE
ncbi:MAG: 2-oxoacid:ferredoxin oxidoreductase subunit beta [Candidatus Aminicenantes bacterium]|nr:MAG: 2-oxoacid:ferredoxin oxidoreductase subunit beta [Candidatus Aminicenantes bacterium]